MRIITFRNVAILSLFLYSVYFVVITPFSKAQDSEHAHLVSETAKLKKQHSGDPEAWTESAQLKIREGAANAYIDTYRKSVVTPIITLSICSLIFGIFSRTPKYSDVLIFALPVLFLGLLYASPVVSLPFIAWYCAVSINRKIKSKGQTNLE